MVLTYILSRTVFQLSRRSRQIIDLDKGVPLVKAFVLGKLCEYRHKSCIAKTRFFILHFVTDNICLYSTNFT